MNIFLIVILSLLTLIILVGIFLMYRSLKSVSSVFDIPTKLDVNLSDLNVFIRKEFLFEFIKWIMKDANVINMNSIDHGSSFINDLKNPSVVESKLNIFVSLIVSKMSKKLKYQFKAVYTNDEDDSGLYEYVARQVMFYIRRVNYEITMLFETNKSISTTDILKNYIVRLENEIYELNGVVIFSLPDNTEMMSEDKD